MVASPIATRSIKDCSGHRTFVKNVRSEYPGLNLLRDGLLIGRSKHYPQLKQPADSPKPFHLQHFTYVQDVHLRNRLDDQIRAQ
eukprot:scaffold3670_cov124-Cylindrotheca_fusiformis.AAC.3